ncbi:hypothetical protein BX616_006559 [Lobosporangium transversale]|uniref:MSP domain-containing protein n=1 Tax=Lobosporangium transversale TaxID=64571 RepID=A0A1Y2GTZ2_9FUNG|nr:hypothetical protein BCR41DRAFT_350080 [Lobosporangium transversale]KAF9915262.1 hypothetical protein BX616_006559 [Lobosporangium transversale]ORZ21819.1 hypothetical protein BCR41DRAFT_350080 [Lobosporangium transversale]|eukprot:XP_021883070.1 hypothetical protein BCR41DRAFT_350080 [Lobosporangium transversale]
MKYSVKPVFGTLRPGESVKIFVRSDKWVSPQDKFLLQTVALTNEETLSLSPLSWKALDSKRILENYITCSSQSALSLQEPEDDVGSLSSSSVTSSSPISSAAAAYIPSSAQFDVGHSTPSLHNQQHLANASLGATASVRQRNQQVFERWQYTESTRLNISMDGLGRRLSNSSSACSSATTSPGSYPIQFTDSRQSFDSLPSPVLTSPVGVNSKELSSKRNSTSLNLQRHPSIIMSTAEGPKKTSMNEIMRETEPPSQNTFEFLMSSLLSTLKSPAKGDTNPLLNFRFFYQRSKRQMLVFSFVCLLFGMLVPLGHVLSVMNARTEGHKMATGNHRDICQVIEVGQSDVTKLDIFDDVSTVRTSVQSTQ